MRPKEHKVAIAGLGAIGKTLAAKLDAGIPGIRLVAAASRDAEKARQFVAGLKGKVALVPLSMLSEQADIVIECAPAHLLPEIAEPTLRAGRQLMVLSAGALLEHEYLIGLAREHGGQIVVPTGALIGLDAVTAAAEGVIRSVTMITRKPVKGLIGAPYLVENGIRIEDIREPLRIYSGTAREAARGFPANLNVAIALSLAGIGPDRTMLEIWADPAQTRNTHRIEVEADSASFSMAIENVPSENPRTGRITALSVIATLRKLHSPLRLGT